MMCVGGVLSLCLLNGALQDLHVVAWFHGPCCRMSAESRGVLGPRK